MIDIEQFALTGELFDGRYKLIRSLNKDGATADVWLATDMNTVDTNGDFDDDDAVYINGERVDGTRDDQALMVAIKIYRPKNALDIEGEQRFREEFKIVYNCRQTNLLQPTHFSIFQEVPYLVLPFCRDGSAEKYVGQGCSDVDMLWKFVSDVASGLAYLHACQPPIIHQDIKPANILIDGHQNFTITDFGISSTFGGNQHGYDDENAGTLAYMAPERFAEDHVPSAPGDIWALGATLYEMITGQVPFGEDGGAAQPDGPFTLTFPKDTPQALQKLIIACLAKDPAARPTAAYLIKAGLAHQYPVKKKRIWPWFLLAFLLVAATWVAFWFFTPKTEEKIVTVIEEAEPPRPAKEVFEEALPLLASTNPQELQQGLAVMDSLAGTKYVPALWELALTYGWFTDSTSVSRKQILGIATGNTNVSPEAQAIANCLPRQDDINQKAMGLFNMIVDQADDSQLELRMKSAFTLGIYYAYYSRNNSLAKQQFRIARDTAAELGDDAMKQRAEAALQTFE